VPRNFESRRLEKIEIAGSQYDRTWLFIDYRSDEGT
jgi:hypothetical protein